MSEDSRHRSDAAKRLVDALKRDQFLLYCQPILPLQERRRGVQYFEVLVRFLEEEQKLMPPGTFIPILEEAGLMPLLDRWVIEQLLKWVVEQRGREPNRPLPWSSVNLSGDSLRDPHFAAYVRRHLAVSQIPADRLSFELPVKEVRHDRKLAVAMAQELHPMGCPLAISGFTGGVSLLPGLHKLGVRIVKLDGSLARGLSGKPANLEKLKSIAAACKALGMRTVAEMVEEPEAVEALREAGIDYAQGFGIALPIPIESMR